MRCFAFINKMVSLFVKYKSKELYEEIVNLKEHNYNMKLKILELQYENDLLKLREKND